MKKILLILIALFAVTALALPQFVGVKAQEQLNTRVAEIWSNKVFDVKPTDYQRGWYSSVARVEIGLTDDYKRQLEDSVRQNNDDAQVDLKIENLREYLDVTIPLRVDVRHGPVLKDVDGNGGWTIGLASTETHIDSDTEWVSEFLALAQIPYMFRLHTYSDFSGVTEFDGDMPAFTIQEQAFRVAFTGVNLVGTFEYELMRLVANAQLNGMEFESGDVRSAFRNMQISSDNYKYSDYLWTGKADGSIAEISIRSNAAENPFLVRIDGFEISTDTQVTDEKLTLDATYSVEKIQLPDENVVDDLQVGFGFNNIDVTSIEYFYELQQTTPAGSNEMTPEIQAAIFDLLASSPTLQFDPLSFKWKNEPLAARISLEVDGQSLPAKDQFDVMNIAVWMNVLTARTHVDLSRVLATEFATQAARQQLEAAALQGADIAIDRIDMMAEQQAPILLLTLEQQGIITPGGHGYTSEITYVDGELLINGKPMPFSPLQ